jgi:hypothetical protein
MIGLQTFEAGGIASSGVLAAVVGAVHEMRDLLREDQQLRDRVADHERRLTAVETPFGLRTCALPVGPREFAANAREPRSERIGDVGIAGTVGWRASRYGGLAHRNPRPPLRSDGGKLLRVDESKNGGVPPKPSPRLTRLEAAVRYAQSVHGLT